MPERDQDGVENLVEELRQEHGRSGADGAMRMWEQSEGEALLWRAEGPL